MMFGYACRQTPELMPLPIMLAHRLMLRQAQRWRSRCLHWLRPDGKSLVSIRYRDSDPESV